MLGSFNSSIYQMALHLVHCMLSKGCQCKNVVSPKIALALRASLKLSKRGTSLKTARMYAQNKYTSRYTCTMFLHGALLCEIPSFCKMEIQRCCTDATICCSKAVLWRFDKQWIEAKRSREVFDTKNVFIFCAVSSTTFHSTSSHQHWSNNPPKRVHI